MNITCIACQGSFYAETFRGYCDPCIAEFAAQRAGISRRQRPAPNVYADGKFAEGSPQTVVDPVSGSEVCGLCGSSEIEPGYGLGSGYGIGSYVFCNECYAFLNFSEDTE